jgi:predicted RNase H-like HicB family nuclease
MESNGTYTFTMLFEPAEEGGYVVTCPALPGLVTEGDTMEEARRMAEDALRGYLESLAGGGATVCRGLLTQSPRSSISK